MDCQKIPFEKVLQFSHFDHLYAAKQELFRELLPFPCDMEGIRQAIEVRKETPGDRAAIHRILTEQYADYGIAGRGKLIDSLLSDHTFTIVTAHQPYLFGGPLYFVLKILSAAKLAQQCRDSFPGYDFIPVFYIGGEDHDLDECNNVTVFGKSVLWQTDQTGPVGRMSTVDLNEALEYTTEILGDSPNGNLLSEMLRRCYEPGKTVNEAITHFIHSLLEEFPVLVLNADNITAKTMFTPVIRAEVIENVAEPLVLEQQEKMRSLGLKPQAFVRPINFFYLSPEGRNRIVREGDRFLIHNTKISFTPAEMEAEIRSYPERFSPNVIMRPLYQEFLLPSVAFVGGGGELAYWSDRRLLFEHFKIPMPVLVRRDSMVIVDSASRKKLQKLNLTVPDLFRDPNELKTAFLDGQAESAISFKDETRELALLIKKLQEKVANIDPTLSGFVGSETSSFFKSVDHIESRVRKSLSNKHNIEIQQLTALQQKFFPSSSLQERTESFMSFYIKMGNDLFKRIYACCNPLDFRFKIIEE